MAYWCAVNYRDGYGLHATNGILFNHESPRRGETFVTRKITRAVAKIATGSKDKLYLGNLDAVRDWGYAKEYVESMWLMLQQEQPEDYVIATGEQHSVREFLRWAAADLGITLRFEGTGIDERGFVAALAGDAGRGRTHGRAFRGAGPRGRTPRACTAHRGSRAGGSRSAAHLGRLPIRRLVLRRDGRRNAPSQSPLRLGGTPSARGGAATEDRAPVRLT